MIPALSSFLADSTSGSKHMAWIASKSRLIDLCIGSLYGSFSSGSGHWLKCASALLDHRTLGSARLRLMVCVGLRLLARRVSRLFTALARSVVT